MSQARSGRVSFLDLPAELRLKVYSDLFGFEETTLPRWGINQPPRTIQLLKTCRQIHDEARPVFYRQTSLVINGNKVLPFPDTIIRHMGGTNLLSCIRELTLIEPRAMPYRYVHLKKRIRIDFRFDLLRFLPGVRTVNITDHAPIPLHLIKNDPHCEFIMAAIEGAMRRRLVRMTELLGDTSIKDYPAVNIFATARISFDRAAYPAFDPISLEDEMLQLHRCKWQKPNPGYSCSGEVLAKVKLYPSRDLVAVKPVDMDSARYVITRHQHDDAWFPVRNLTDI